MGYQEPDFLPWDGRRVPMTFLAGYLGAGKTTVINELLSITDRPIAVLVNDVGEVNIDAALIRRRNGDTIELTDGCVCCSLSEGFAAAIDTLRSRLEPPDHVIVELSGIADPARVLPWSRSAGFRLDGVVTLIDVEQFGDRMAEPVSAATMVAQIQAADLITLTKLDLSTASNRVAVVDELQRRAPETPIVEADAQLAATLLELGRRDPDGTAVVEPPTLFDRHVTTLVSLPRPTDRDELEALLDELPAETVRAKGIAQDRSGVGLLIQVVGHRRSITELPAPEREPPTDLVVISLPKD